MKYHDPHNLLLPKQFVLLKKKKNQLGTLKLEKSVNRGGLVVEYTIKDEKGSYGNRRERKWKGEIEKRKSWWGKESTEKGVEG